MYTSKFNLLVYQLLLILEAIDIQKKEGSDVSKEVFCVLCICHFIGDYFLQTSYVSMRKEKSHRYTFIHSALYSIPFVIFFIFNGFTKEVFFIVLLSIMMHCLIDHIKCYITYSLKKDVIKIKISSLFLYFFDQILHIYTMFIFSYYIFDLSQIKLFVLIDNINIRLLSAVLFFVVMFQPAYVTYLLASHRPREICNTVNKEGLLMKFQLELIAAFWWFQNIYILCFIIGFQLWQYKTKHCYQLFNESFHFLLMSGVSYLMILFMFLK